tara:strand:- start:2088 stop:2708 length:621 start_codon:yes stop_codon:yes gene_type:complete
MTITYPLSIPTNKNIKSVDFRAINAVAYSTSPFTFSGQAFAYAGQMWQADITLPSMRRSDAEQWVAWLISLRGQFGTFLLGDFVGGTARGAATGTPVVNGASQSGGALIIDGAASSVTGWLKAGDYIQLGTGLTSRLHKVLQDSNSDSGGNVTLDIWPHLRSSPAEDSAVVVSSAKGVFRLASNETAWKISDILLYGITFGVAEVI